MSEKHHNLSDSRNTGMNTESGTGPGDSASRQKAKSAWHYQPPLPIKASPYFHWPLNIKSIAKWMVSGWLPVSERLIILLLALVANSIAQPSFAVTGDLTLTGLGALYLRNFLLMWLVAGGLHWYFYSARKQDDQRRYDTRPFPTDSRGFTFGSQVRDNMFWTLASGVTVWTLYESLMLWSLANGYAPALHTSEQWPWLLLMIFLLPMWETTHFFLIHRLIHTSRLYQRVHALHHRNTNVGPWSGLSMHPIEHFVYLSTVLIHFIIPSTPLLIAFHLMYFTLSAATTHTGYQGILWQGKLVLPLGTFHHQLHHRYFTCNYGGLEMPWDQWTGSFHDGTPESHQTFLKNRKSVRTKGD